MKIRTVSIALTVVFLGGFDFIRAQNDKKGFVDLFNGRDLSGWYNVNGAPETWSVKDGMIHCTGKPSG